MQKLSFSTSINASKSKLWQVLWNDASYRSWTTAFHEGSYAVTDNWKQGTEVKFLGPDGSGMVSMVVENRPEEFMSFEHLGEIKNGVEDRTSDAVKSWAGARENYRLTEKDGVTELAVDMDMDEGFAAMFSEMWPKALQKIKELAEGTGNELAQG